ncbi:MAG: cytochrome P450 [Solirubrobacterales bacterium]
MSPGGRRQLPSASLAESVGFTLKAMVPNLIQGLFRRRRRAVAVATRLDLDRLAVAEIRDIRRKHGPGPVWVRAGGDRMLLALARDDVRRALEGSPYPFAPDPEAKRRGMSHFQPDALTISRGELWRNRRRFAESVLDTGKPVHRLGDHFLEVVSGEVGALLDGLRGRSKELDFDGFHRAGWRITRRIVLGDGARDDAELTEMLAKLMDEANRLPKSPSEELEPYLAKVGGYVATSEPGSLAGLISEAPSDADTRVERQLTHWLFATGDTLSANVMRALALIVSHPRQAAVVDQELRARLGEDGAANAAAVSSLAYLEACLQEAMRLWPTTPFLSRETLEETEWDGARVPAGTQLLISNTFNHRDPERAGVDRFEPEAWTEGDRAEDWSLNHFSHGPQGCPGAGLALFIGKALLASLLTQRTVRLFEPALHPERSLPQMLDFFRLRFALEPRA